MSRVRQIAGVVQIDAALRTGEEVRLVLVAEDARAEDVRGLIARAEESGVTVRTATRNVIARLSAPRPAEDALALLGRDPEAELPASLARGGAFWLLVGVAYPGNVGMVVRTAEVSGADAIAIDGSFDHEAKRAALRASMRADKFMPVYWRRAGEILDAAREAGAGHRVIALDESAATTHFAADLRGPRIFVVGGENGGIPRDVLARCDERVCIPMAGFIPCYNLQAAVSAVAVERLRQAAALPKR
ncbi:MAG: TrmH family RNA methyltransferase [Myxococcota bacterium]